jgi:hypothetical protein
MNGRLWVEGGMGHATTLHMGLPSV